jgi:hypothetical protein
MHYNSTSLRKSWWKEGFNMPAVFARKALGATKTTYEIYLKGTIPHKSFLVAGFKDVVCYKNPTLGKSSSEKEDSGYRHVQ